MVQGRSPNHQANHHDYCRFLVQKSRDTNRNTNIYQDHVLSRMSKLVGTRARTGDPLILCPPHLIFVEPRSENSLKYSSSVIPPSAHFRAIAGADRSKLHLKMSKSSTWLAEFCDQREVSASTPRPILTRQATRSSLKEKSGAFCDPLFRRGLWRPRQGPLSRST